MALQKAAFVLGLLSMALQQVQCDNVPNNMNVYFTHCNATSAPAPPNNQSSQIAVGIFLWDGTLKPANAITIKTTNTFSPALGYSYKWERGVNLRYPVGAEFSLEKLKEGSSNATYGTVVGRAWQMYHVEGEIYECYRDGKNVVRVQDDAWSNGTVWSCAVDYWCHGVECYNACDNW